MQWILSSNQKLWLGYALVMLIIGFIVLVGISRITRIHETLEEIVTHKQFAIEMVARMQQPARERAVLLYSIASTKAPF